MKLSIDQSLATSFFWRPVAAGWSLVGQEPAIRPALAAGDVDAETAALISAAEATRLAATHAIDPRAGVIFDNSSDIAVRFPVRPDEIEQSDVVLYGVSGTAEVLARATLWPFYGIKTGRWLMEPSEGAQVTIIEGPDALEAPETGFQEDLSRAWFIMTDQPVVSHLFLLPLTWSTEERDRIVAGLVEAHATGWERRRDVRAQINAETGVSNERLVEYFARMRWTLSGPDRDAFRSVLYRGMGGTQFENPDRLRFFDEIPPPTEE